MNFFDDEDGGYDLSGGKGGLFQQEQRKSKKAKKDSQTYGIFGEGEGSSEEDSRKKDKPSFLQPKLAMSQMNFIKSDKILYQPEAGKVRVNFGKKKAEAQEKNVEKGKDDDKKKVKKSVQISEERNEEMVFEKGKGIRTVDDFVLSDDEIQEEEDMVQARLNKEVMKRKSRFNLKNTNQKQEMGDFGLPSVLGKRKNPMFEMSRQEKSAEQKAEEAMIEDMGDASVKALKIMQSFGYKVGKGLGVKEQGRVEPVKAVKKTVLDGKRTAASAQNFQFDRNPMGEDLMKDLLEEEGGDENIEVQERPKLWKKGKRRTGINKKGNFLRAEATPLGSLKDAEIAQPMMQQQKIIDMRGPQTMYFEDYSSIKTFEQPRQKITSIPSSQTGALGEMLFTLRGHVDKSKHNILSNERKIKIEKDKIVNFNYEKSQLENEQVKYQTDIENLKVLKAKLTLFKASSETINSRNVLELFNDCFEATSEQFAYLNLEHLFIDTINKKLQTELQNWKITPNTIDEHFSLFEDIKEFLKKILQYKEYLKFKSYTDKSSTFDFSTNNSYDEQKLQNYMSSLFSQTWTSPIRNHILNEWNPTDPDVLIAVFDQWKSLVPASLLTQLFDSVLMPKLQQYVDAWSPTTEKIPIHISLHPWFPLLGEKRLEQLWKSIQLKISQLLQKWEPQDKSALILLKPWLRVFDRSSWENLIIRLILPKLLYGLKDFEINPKKQKIEPLKWLLGWADYIPQDNLIFILESYVFKKLVEVLKEWISSPGCKLEEVRGWLNGWKELIGEKIMSLAAVRHEFDNIERMIK